MKTVIVLFLIFCGFYGILYLCNEIIAKIWRKPQILIWIEKMFEHAEKRQWYETYHCFDIHGVISKPDYRKTEKVGQEFKINYYPYAKETLQFLTKNRPDMILFIFTSSYKKEIESYMEQFKKDEIYFNYLKSNISTQNLILNY
jgi:hypothetical protein